MKNIAFFLDRDGVINKERKDYVKSINEFEIIDGALEAIKLIKENGFYVVIITNQSAVNRNLINEEKLLQIHKSLKDRLNFEFKTKIDGIYFCPHTPEENCECRKPKPGLFLEAAKELNINLENSIMIGDSQKDIDAAHAVKCKSILLKNNEKLIDVVRNYLSLISHK
jgi:D,D-heptose 1,7-bisphosphate phosphatase